MMAALGVRTRSSVAQAGLKVLSAGLQVCVSAQFTYVVLGIEPAPTYYVLVQHSELRSSMLAFLDRFGW